MNQINGACYYFPFRGAGNFNFSCVAPIGISCGQMFILPPESIPSEGSENIRGRSARSSAHSLL